MPLDTTVADAILKIDYEGPVREQLNLANVLLTKLKKTPQEDFVGRQVYIPVHYGQNVGVGARREAGVLPVAGSQLFDKATYTVKYLYGRIKLTGQVISSTKNSVGSFIRALDAEMKGITKDVKTDLNRQIWHDGSCALTKCATTSNSTSVEVESTKFLKAGMPIEVRVGTTGAVSTGALDRTVSSVTDSNTFVISGAAITTDNTFYVFRKLTRGLTSEGFPVAWDYTSETWGLEALLSDANPGVGLVEKVGELDRSTKSWWKSTVMTNPAGAGTARAVDLDLMQWVLDNAEIEGESQPGIILTNHALKRRYAALLVADKRYPAGGEITLDGGYKALEFSGIPLVADKDASLTATPQVLNRMYFVSLDSMEWQLLEDWQWMQRDGAVLHRLDDYDMYGATLYSYQNLIVTRPNANVVLADLSES